MYRTAEPTAEPARDLLAAPWGSRRLPLPWSEPVSFDALAAPCRPEVPGQRPASADLLPHGTPLGS